MKNAGGLERQPIHLVKAVLLFTEEGSNMTASYGGLQVVAMEMFRKLKTPKANHIFTSHRLYIFQLLLIITDLSNLGHKSFLGSHSFTSTNILFHLHLHFYTIVNVWTQFDPPTMRILMSN
jgi:hypothetical protein